MFNDLRSEVIVRLVVIVGIIYIFWLKLTVHKWYLLWTLGFCFLRYRWPWPFLAIFIRPFSFPVAKDFQTVWLSNIVVLSVPDDGYSTDESCVLHLISTFFLCFYHCCVHVHIIAYQDKAVNVKMSTGI